MGVTSAGAPGRGGPMGWLLVGALVLTACASDAAGAPDATSTTSPAATTTTAPSATSTTSTSSSSTTTTSTTTTTTTTTTTAPPPTAAPSSTTAAPTSTVEPLPDPALPATSRVFARLAESNAGASMTVVRDGVTVFSFASGTTLDGQRATPDSPLVVASLAKLVTAAAISHLDRDGSVSIADPVPWAAMGLAPHPAWGDVTVRELLDHTSGVPIERSAWFTGEGSCAEFLPRLLATPPRAHRGEWTYSNGNYCALGLLIEAVTGLPLTEAVQELVFSPLGVDGIHSTDGGLLPGDLPHRSDVARYSRLGGAGGFVVSTADLAAMLDGLEPADLERLVYPGVFTDQYGWGHTGTVIGAKGCAWVLEGGRTIVVAVIAGDSAATGGGVCDQVVPAVAGDLGIAAGEPERLPR